MPSILHKSSKTLLQKYSICNGETHHHNSRKKENFRTYGYPEKVVKIGIQKALKIPQTELIQTKTFENSNNLTFISIFNPSNAKIFDLVRFGI